MIDPKPYSISLRGLYGFRAGYLPLIDYACSVFSQSLPVEVHPLAKWRDMELLRTDLTSTALNPKP